jgi:hypothetical protein
LSSPKRKNVVGRRVRTSVLAPFAITSSTSRSCPENVPAVEAKN